MPSKQKKDQKKPSKKTGAIVNPNVGNYETHPFFVKKAKKAKAYLDAVGLPKQLATKS